MRTLLAALAALAVLASAAPAAAFCGFYVAGGDAKLFNEATQVVMLRKGNRTVLSMQNSYKGPTQDFAMVVPVSQVLQEADVKTLPKAVFDRIDNLSAPRLVEYWEQDPCNPPRTRHKPRRKGRASKSAGRSIEDQGLVTVEAEFEVGEYQVVVLSAKESTALETWLNANKYNIPKGSEPYFRPYIEAGQYFFVARVDKKKVKFENGEAVLSPLRFSYESETFQLPIRLGMINSNGKQDLLVYILAENQRYEAANATNVFIPTNLEVAPSVAGQFGDFYRALFDRVSEENPGAVVTEYAWSTSSCDPCPGPTLSESDLMTLGADTFVEFSDEASSFAVPAPKDSAPINLFADPPADGEQARKKKTTVASRSRKRPRGPRGPRMARGWSVTRLHARYSPDEVGEDLVFQKAGPVSGGNERPQADGTLSTGAESSHSNTFQGRYIIRHEWVGEVACDNPQRGVWGGKTHGEKPLASASPSPNTSGVRGATGKVDLSTALKTTLASTTAQPEAKPEIPPVDEGGRAPTNEAPAESAPPEPPDAAAPRPSNCAVASGSGALSFNLLIFALAAAMRRRRSSTLEPKLDETHE